MTGILAIPGNHSLHYRNMEIEWAREEMMEVDEGVVVTELAELPCNEEKNLEERFSLFLTSH